MIEGWRESRGFLAGLMLVCLLSGGARLAYFELARESYLGNRDTPGYEGLAHSLLVNGEYRSMADAGAPCGFPADLQRPRAAPLGYSRFRVHVMPGVCWLAAIGSKRILAGLSRVCG